MGLANGCHDNEQLYLAIGILMLFNAGMIGILVAYINSKLSGTDERFRGIDQPFDAIDKRFDDMRDLWRAELHRVEELLDARLKHLEQR